MPSNGDRLLASTGDCSPAALASAYSETAWKKLYPINGHISSSSIVHSARPLRISHSSLTSSGHRGHSRNRNGSCERKKQVLQTSTCASRSRAKIIQRPHAANTAIGKENEAIADSLGVQQLMDGKNKCPALGDLFAQHTGNVACLPEVEAVERFVHEEQRMRREQSQRQQEPSAVALRQRVHALGKSRPQTDRFDRICNLVCRSSVDICEER